MDDNEVILILTREEAQTLADILYNVGGKGRRAHADNISLSLHNVGIKPQTNEGGYEIPDFDPRFHNAIYFQEAV